MNYALECRLGRAHQFDAISGWCDHGCGVRDDGRVINKGGDPIRLGRDYTPEDLHALRQRAETTR